ncbi:MAG TPA: SNF2-related protein [Bacillota bacterium]|nr:SNF2-related protein [Bacillota bacterium]HPT87780.1 SNF2-related protein [Bacillota bacterium]
METSPHATLSKPEPERALPDFSPVFQSGNAFSEFLLRMRRKEWDSWEAFLLHHQGIELTLSHGFEDLLVISHLQEHWRKNGFVLYPHQIETVKKVISEMRGRAILADEVGLGKTIEAAMILKEYMLRGLVKRFLILTPAALCRQWEAELREKFEIHTLIANREWEWANYDQIIASLDTAKKECHRNEILKNYYDMVIVDEAHKLKSDKTQNFQFVNSIQKKYFLLLSATPLQNDLKELFNMISLLRPGQLGSYRNFKKNYIADKRKPKNAGELKSLLSGVMIRNKHGAHIGFTKRNVQNIPIVLSPMEREMYDRTTDFIRRCLKNGPAGMSALPLLTLQREICSSTFAAVLTLYKLAHKILMDEAQQQEAVSLLKLAQQIKNNAKMAVVEELIRKTPEKVIIFTEFLATQSYIRTRLEQAGFLTLAFDGSLSASKKEFTKYQFKEFPQYRVLVCTESGGEGINLQFCNTMINYDLPWNPMRLEQRIGRIHRLGQTRDVYVYNLSIKDTVEEHLLRLLDEKVKMFHTVIGESERVIGKLCRGKSLEARIMELVFQADSHESLSRGFERLGQEIEAMINEDTPDWEELL